MMVVRISRRSAPGVRKSRTEGRIPCTRPMLLSQTHEMMRYALPSLLMVVAAAASLSCGSSGGSEARPIEALYYVSGGPSLDFAFADSPDEAGCGSSGTGI